MARARWLHLELRERSVDERRHLLEVARELRAAGLSYPAMAVVMGRYEGLEASEEQLRYWLVNHGEVPNQAKAAASRRAAMRRSVREAA